MGGEMRPDSSGLFVRLAVGGMLLMLPPAAAPGALSAEKVVIQIVPGARTMTSEEKVLQPDAALVSQHGIILVDETIRDESQGSESNITRHVRAKIFSSEARN